MVYVLSKDGKPLMPTQRHGKVRHLLKEGKAKVVKKTPFTIQLLYDSPEYTQPVTLGVDAGSKHIGISASTKEKELLAMDVELRTDIQEKLSTRREARRTRRGRKTRYRKPRFNNRVSTKKKGWLAPSVEHKIECHLQTVGDVCSLLPVTKIVMETASFDTQKLKNPEIEGKEYQQGDQLGFWNIREYVLFRDDHECQHCHGKSKDPVLNIHHLESRKTGGNSPENLITLCETCHQKYHTLNKEQQKQWKLPKRGKSYRDAAFMGIMRWAFFDRLKETHSDIPVLMTFGYLTKNKRIKLGLTKQHYNDAYCISGNLNAKPLDKVLFKRKIRRHNRQLHKFNPRKGGKRKSNQAPYLVKGFRLFDAVQFNNQQCFITGRRVSGYFVLKMFDFSNIHNSASWRNLKLIERARGYISQMGGRQFLPTLSPGGL